MPANVADSPPQPFRFPDTREIPEPRLLFSPSDRDAVNVHPLRGLTQFGPYSDEVTGAVPPVVRIATLAPPGSGRDMSNLIRLLLTAQPKRTRSDYLIDYPGMNAAFGVDLGPADERSHVRFAEDLPARMAAAPNPHTVLAAAVADGLRSLRDTRSDYDIVWLYLPDSLAAGFYGDDEDPFDLHSFVKGTSAALGIPTQLVRQRTAQGERDACSVGWTLSLACYAKAGGTPYKVDRVDDGTAFLGLAYTLKRVPGHTRFVTCCAQVFDAEGSGLEFLAYEVREDDGVIVKGRNPFLTRQQMRTVVSRAVGLYADRHAGRHPQRMVVHKSTEFFDREVDGCLEALEGVPDVQLVQVQQDTPWRAIRYRGRQAQGFPVDRGTLVHAGDNEVLLWTQGAVDEIPSRNPYYKEGTGIPAPVLLRRWAGDGPAEPLAAEVLALTKMDWNSETLYGTLPVTLSYASKVADALGSAPRIGPLPYSYKYFI